MSEIGPQIPEHLLRQTNTDSAGDEEEVGPSLADIGPQLPSSLKRKHGSDREDEIGPALPPVDNSGDDSDSDDDYAPALPPDLAEAAPPAKRRVAGPSLPPSGLPEASSAHYRRAYEEEDDVVGPRVELAAYELGEEEEAMMRMEDIERRARKAKEDAEGGDKEEKLERGEWMLVPPELKKLGMTVELKPRGFAKNTKDHNPDRSGWTDTPADKERKRQEAQRRGAATANPPPQKDDDEPELTARDIEQAQIAARLNKERGSSLMDSFTANLTQRDMDKDNAAGRKFDRDKDLVSRRVDPKARQRIIEQSRELDSKFGRGKYL